MWGCIVPWNYPLLLLAWKLAPGARRRQHGGGQAVRAHAALHADAGLLLRAPARRARSTSWPARATWARRSCATRAWTAWRSPARWPPASAWPRRCAERVARVNLEMGGKDPFIVCADVADQVEVAAKGGAWAAYLNAGQVCTSAERFYVARELYDDFVEVFVEHARSLRVGDPLDDDTDVGPDGLGGAARQGRGAGRGRGGGRRDARGGRRPRRPAIAATSTPPRSSPAPPRRPTCCARRPSGRWRRSCRWTRSTRRSRWPTAPASASGRTSTRATSRRRCAACARSGPARSG